MTPYSEVFNSFKDLIIRDTTFFIKNPDATTVEQIAEIRMLKLLNHAITNIMLVRDKRNFEINFLEVMDNNLKQFNEDLTRIEIDIIAYFMWQCYIDEEVVVRLKELKNIGFSDDEIKFFSPANSLKEFKDTYDKLKNENINRVKEYKRRGRKDFKLKTHNFIFNE